MNSSFVSIATLVKSNLGEMCLINILMNISSNGLRDYLESGKAYKGTSSKKKKTDLVEMIVYGHITDKINKMRIEDISKKEANQILRSNKILVKSLPGHGNIGLKGKEIGAYDNKEGSIKIIGRCYNKKITHALIHLFKTKSVMRKITQTICACINSFI